jgi:hypothetical protein
MKRGAAWTDRVVGRTDAYHNALAIDPVTLAEAEGGVTLKPKHVQDAYRQLAGVKGSTLDQRYPLGAEPVAFFDPGVGS